METKLITKLQDKEYRDAFVTSQINIELPFQIRALREERGWTQSQLAEKAGMAQPRISAIEAPGKGKLNLDTLLRLASAFDVGLIVRFALFTEIVEWVKKFSPDTFSVKSFAEDAQTYSSTARADMPLRTLFTFASQVPARITSKVSTGEHVWNLMPYNQPVSTGCTQIAH